MKGTRWLGTNLWQYLDGFPGWGNRCDVAVAYVSTDAFLRLQKGDRLIVNASEKAIALRQTSAAVLSCAFKRGVRVYSDPGLHAKVYLSDSEVIVGSANLSSKSRQQSEGALVSRDPSILKAGRRWFEAAIEKSTRLDAAAIERLGRIPITYRPGRGKLPTLLQALSQQLPIINDFVFGLYVCDAELATRAVKEGAKRARVFLPRDSNAWTWFEDPFSRKSQERMRRQLGNKQMLALYGQAGGGVVSSIDELDDEMFSFLDCFRVGGDLVFVFDTRKRAPIALGGPDAAELCRRLTAALIADRRRAKAWHDSESGLLTSRQLTAALDV